MASPAKKAKTQQVCPYGARCYRKNPDHLKEFFHPQKDGTDSSVPMAGSSSVGSQVDTSSLPACKYGASCYRKNLLHFAEYSHPTKKKNDDSDSGNDTDVYSSDEDKKKKDTKKKGGLGDILNRGMSLVKTYSQMTEDERKELIKKAFEAKQKLQKELEDTKDEIKKKEKALEKLQEQVNTGLLLVDGEKEALKGTKTVYFSLSAERDYKEGSAAQTHFRLAESQFYRLLSGSYSSNYRVVKVDYVVNPELVEDFKHAREDLKKHRGEDTSYPVLAFHGTKEENITKIAETGFQVPGEKGFKHRTDTGWYGKGVYFSEFPSYSMSYIQGSTKLLLCQVLCGKVYKCTKLIHGHKLMSGYDSHTSPDNKELVIFNSHHILPSYIVHYETSASGDFKYSKPVTKKTTATTDTTTDSGDNDLDKYFDSVELLNKSVKAQSAKATKIFKDHTFQFTGAFSLTQANMMNLVQKHGAKKGTASVFTILVADKDEFEMKSNKCLKANSKGVPIVVEMFVYDSIIAKKLLNIDDYAYET